MAVKSHNQSTYATNTLISSWGQRAIYQKLFKWHYKVFSQLQLDCHLAIFMYNDNDGIKSGQG